MGADHKVPDSVRDQDIIKFHKQFKTVNGTPQLPLKNVRIHDASLAHMVKCGQLLKCEKGDLRPNAALNPILAPFFTAKETGNDIPIYVAVGAGSETTDFPTARRMRTKEGKPYILINEGYHEWTEDYVSEQFLYSEKEIGDLIHKKAVSSPADCLEQLRKKKKNSPELAAMERRFNHIIDSITQESDMLVGDLRVFIDNTPPQNYATSCGASSATTQENRNIIWLEGNKNLEKTLASDDATEAFIMENKWHEFTHLYNGDNTAAGVIRTRDVDTTREAELLAVLGAVALGHNPEDLIRDYDMRLRTIRTHLYLKLHPDSKISKNHLTAQDLKIISDWDQSATDQEHPSFLQLIDALNTEKQLMQKYEAGLSHGVDTLAGREAEWQWLLQQPEIIAFRQRVHLLAQDEKVPPEDIIASGQNPPVNSAHVVEQLGIIKDQLKGINQKPDMPPASRTTSPPAKSPGPASEPHSR